LLFHKISIGLRVQRIECQACTVVDFFYGKKIGEIWIVLLFLLHIFTQLFVIQLFILKKIMRHSANDGPFLPHFFRGLHKIFSFNTFIMTQNDVLRRCKLLILNLMEGDRG
jgi:hypothetical protein